MKKIIVAAMALVLTKPVFADVQMTILDGEGRTSIISSDGNRARIEEQGEPGFIVIDYSAREMLIVDTQRGEVMSTSLGKGTVGVTGSGGVDVRLQGKGGGPVIAGYGTKKYSYTANGESCGIIYASKKLLENSGVRGLFESMRAMQAQSRSMMQGMGSGFLNLCQQANLLLTDSLEEIGAPMRIIGQDGQVESEVLRVKKDANFPSSHYEAPAGMTPVDMQQKVQEAMQGTGEMMQGTEIPDMNELMQQMEESGMEIPDEAMEQLKQLQQQLQQMQQQ